MVIPDWGFYPITALPQHLHYPHNVHGHREVHWNDTIDRGAKKALFCLL